MKIGCNDGKSKEKQVPTMKKIEIDATSGKSTKSNSLAEAQFDEYGCH